MKILDFVHLGLNGVNKLVIWLGIVLFSVPYRQAAEFPSCKCAYIN